MHELQTWTCRDPDRRGRDGSLPPELRERVPARRRPVRFLLAAGCAVWMIAAPARADGPAACTAGIEPTQGEACPAGNDADDGRASPEGLDEALRRGEIRPLDEVLDAIRSKFPGEIVAVETERHGTRWIYEVKLLDPDGRRRTIIIDAGSLAVMKE